MPSEAMLRVHRNHFAWVRLDSALTDRSSREAILNHVKHLISQTEMQLKDLKEVERECSES